MRTSSRVMVAMTMRLKEKSPPAGPVKNQVLVHKTGGFLSQAPQNSDLASKTTLTETSRSLATALARAPSTTCRRKACHHASGNSARSASSTDP